LASCAGKKREVDGKKKKSNRPCSKKRGGRSDAKARSKAKTSKGECGGRANGRGRKGGETRIAAGRPDKSMGLACDPRSYYEKAIIGKVNPFRQWGIVGGGGVSSEMKQWNKNKNAYPVWGTSLERGGCQGRASRGGKAEKLFEKEKKKGFFSEGEREKVPERGNDPDKRRG